jgi:hypothetical protein
LIDFLCCTIQISKNINKISWHSSRVGTDGRLSIQYEAKRSAYPAIFGKMNIHPIYGNNEYSAELRLIPLSSDNLDHITEPVGVGKSPPPEHPVVLSR